LGGGYTDFRNYHFIRRGKGLYGKYEIRSKEDAEQIYGSVSDITFQLSAEDHLNMPELTQTIVKLPLTGKLRRLYDKLDAEYIVEVEGHTIRSNSQATNANKLRQILQGGAYSDQGRAVKLACTAKVDYLKESVDTANGSPILCAIQFKFEYDSICRKMGYTVPKITGVTSASEASKNIAAWNAGNLPLLLVHPGSIKYSINLQAGGHRIIWLALPWSYEAYYQLVRRLYRQGQERCVSSHMVCFDRTVDYTVAAALKKKAMVDTNLKTAMAERGLQL